MYPNFQYFFFKETITIVVPQDDHNEETWDDITSFMSGHRAVPIENYFDECEPCFFSYIRFHPEGMVQDLMYAGMSRNYTTFGFGFYDLNDKLTSDMAETNQVNLHLSIKDHKHLIPENSIPVIDDWLSRNFENFAPLMELTYEVPLFDAGDLEGSKAALNDFKEKMEEYGAVYDQALSDPNGELTKKNDSVESDDSPEKEPTVETMTGADMKELMAEFPDDFKISISIPMSNGGGMTVDKDGLKEYIINAKSNGEIIQVFVEGGKAED